MNSDIGAIYRNSTISSTFGYRLNGRHSLGQLSLNIGMEFSFGYSTVSDGGSHFMSLRVNIDEYHIALSGTRGNILN